MVKESIIFTACSETKFLNRLPHFASHKTNINIQKTYTSTVALQVIIRIKITYFFYIKTMRFNQNFLKWEWRLPRVEIVVY